MSGRWKEEPGRMRGGSQISMRWANGIAVFDVAGYFTEDSEDSLNSVYKEARALGAARFLLNFDGHGLITSAGYGLIIKFLRHTREKGQELQIVQPSARTRRMFQIMGLTATVPVYASESEAYEGFGDES